MRVWESRSPPAYRTTSDEPVSSEVVSVLCFSLADFRRDFSGLSRFFASFEKLADFAANFSRSFERLADFADSAFLGCFLRKMRVQRGVLLLFQGKFAKMSLFRVKLTTITPPVFGI